MKIALDPYMLRKVPLLDLPRVVADLGYHHIEMSPRDDFLPFFVHPRVDKAGVAAFKRALAAASVEVASVLPLYRWSGPSEDERQAAVRYWKRAIEITVDLGVNVMNSEFNGRPSLPDECEAQFWRSMEELLPIFEREGVRLVLEPHPDDFIEDGLAAVNMIRGIDSDLVSFLYCAPHTFHQGGDLEAIMRYAGPLLTQVHIADSFDFRGSSGLRYIVNPPGSTARVHQHLDIGQGEVDWDVFFRTLNELDFDGIATVCVFAWEERAEDSARYNLSQISQFTQKHGSA
ncbi:sugar phosphate isomerase/epimerase family protein [Paractinoplanes atraurantiacus]|uniref:Myo-inositol catabolism protein IolH n=1 Tax=Paractinoplanes atraurantiacus TaxID=1036182 RepID=A0A285IM24_9ACTN|nr:sugar phosphate isomerase/epimerase [Actinoplanes atraurantiacus]SNY48933.1 myo-inositol catabolism protein IolH [Actinoplanes atraurantiacus]